MCDYTKETNTFAVHTDGANNVNTNREEVHRKDDVREPVVHVHDEVHEVHVLQQGRHRLTSHPNRLWPHKNSALASVDDEIDDVARAGLTHSKDLARTESGKGVCVCGGGVEP